MKNLILITMLGLGLAACQKVEPIEAEVPAKALFTARYILPLTEGRPIGEHEIIDVNLTKRTNLAEFKPVFKQIVRDAIDGKIDTYADDVPQPSLQAAPEAKEYLHNHGKKIEEMGAEFSVDTLCASLEVVYKGAMLKDGCKLMPIYMDMIWVDPAANLPDRRMARIFMEDLGDYHIVQSNRKIGIVEYLTGRKYEHYPIYMESPVDSFGIRTFQSALILREGLDKGDLSALKNPIK